MMKLIRQLVVGLWAMALPGAAAASEPQRYAIFWSGLPVGYLDVAESQKAGLWESEARIKTHGLIGWLAPFVNVSHASANCTESACMPLKFESFTQSRSEPKSYIVEYRQPGMVAVRGYDPLYPDNDPEDKHPPVPEELRKGALDPVNFLRELQKEAADLPPEGKMMKMFDSKRLYEVTAKPSQKPCPIKGLPESIGLVLEVKPVAGLSAKERKRYEKRPFSAISVWLDKADSQFQVMRTEVMFGMLVVRPAG